MGTFKVGDVVEWCGNQQSIYGKYGQYEIEQIGGGNGYKYKLRRLSDETVVWTNEACIRYGATPNKQSNTERKLTGLSNDYYKVKVEYPTTPDNTPYLAECNDIIETLKMTYAEANVFKAIWRSAAARLGNGKVDHKAIYDAEKMVFFSQRVLMATKTESKGV